MVTRTRHIVTFICTLPVLLLDYRGFFFSTMSVILFIFISGVIPLTLGFLHCASLIRNPKTILLSDQLLKPNLLILKHLCKVCSSDKFVVKFLT